MAGLGELAATVEGLGYDSVWTAETGSTAFIQAAVVAQATSRARVGTAIALAFPRSPGVAAMTAIDLDELSGGRFVCGLGSQVKRVNEERFSTPFEHPAPKMREYALAMRAFIGGHFGEEPNFEGRFYKVTMAPWPRVPPPVRRDIPIYFAAVNEHMQRAAGEVADGVIGHPMTSVDYINKVVLPAIAKGAAKAGRKPQDCELVQQVIVAISDDREVAKQAAKQQVGFMRPRALMRRCWRCTGSRGSSAICARRLRPRTWASSPLSCPTRWWRPMRCSGLPARSSKRPGASRAWWGSFAWGCRGTGSTRGSWRAITERCSRLSPADTGLLYNHIIVIHPKTSTGQLSFLVDRALEGPSMPTDPSGPDSPAESGRLISAIEIKRSAKRRRTVAARLEGSTLVVYLPERMSRAEEAEWVERMRRRFEDRRRRDSLNSDGGLQRRAQELNRKYFGGALSWRSITYVTNQRERYGSCTVDDGTIRLSDVLAGMPAWVRDYVIVHELAHLLVADHSRAFWKLVRRYPQTERAIGFLIAKGLEE
jgi:hypothetical protein